MSDKMQLAKSWIFAQKIGVDNTGYEKFSWAVDELIDMAVDSHDELWNAIIEILNVDCSEEIIKAVGAGPLEDLILNDGEVFIEKIEKQARESEVFKKAMRSTWFDREELPLSLYERLHAAAEE